MVLLFCNKEYIARGSYFHIIGQDKLIEVMITLVRLENFATSPVLTTDREETISWVLKAREMDFRTIKKK